MFADKQMLREYVKRTLAAAVKPRGNWVHMRCPSCTDQGHHLGYNATTGQVHCLRCNASTNLGGGQRTVRPILEQQTMNEFHQPGLVVGSREWGYAQTRGLRVPDPCLASGRGDAEGCLVFLTWNEYNRVSYLQYRATNSRSRLRYASPANTVPRLQHCGRGSILVLTEGPIDALLVRQATGIWSAALYGSSIGHDVYADIVLADPMLVVLMLDNDEAGRLGTRKAATLLGGADIPTVRVQYEEDTTKDAGDMQPEAIARVVGAAVKRSFEEDDWERAIGL